MEIIVPFSLLDKSSNQLLLPTAVWSLVQLANLVSCQGKQKLSLRGYQGFNLKGDKPFLGLGCISQRIKLCTISFQNFVSHSNQTLAITAPTHSRCFPVAPCKPFALLKQVRGANLVAGQGCVIRDEQEEKVPWNSTLPSILRSSYKGHSAHSSVETLTHAPMQHTHAHGGSQWNV